MKCPVLRSLPRPTISLDSDLREYRTGGSRCPEEEIPNPGPRHVIGHAPHMAVIARPRHPQQLDGGFDSQTCLDPRRFHCGPGWLHIFDSFLKKRISTACSPITVCNPSIFRSSASCWLRAGQRLRSRMPERGLHALEEPFPPSVQQRVGHLVGSSNLCDRLFSPEHLQNNCVALLGGPATRSRHGLLVRQ